MRPICNRGGGRAAGGGCSSGLGLASFSYGGDINIVDVITIVNITVAGKMIFTFLNTIKKTLNSGLVNNIAHTK